jgi:hypothetical protein
MMNGLRGSLYVAFDTTALALTLSMVLMFVQFLVDRFESQLLALVDQRARAEISYQFESASSAATRYATDEQSVERLGQHLLLATREMMMAQTDIWKNTIRSAEEAWASSLTETSDRVRVHWSESVESTVAQLAKGIDGSVLRADESMSRRWKQWQVMLSDNARLMSQQQQELAAQTTALKSLVGKSIDKTESEVVVKDALQGAMKAIATTEKLTTAIGTLSQRVEKLNVVGEAEPPKTATKETKAKVGAETTKLGPKVMKDLARATLRKDVAVTRRQVNAAGEPAKAAVSLNDVATIGPQVNLASIGKGVSTAAAAMTATATAMTATATATGEQTVRPKENAMSADRVNEVVFSVAPYLSGKRADPRRRRPVVNRSTSARTAPARTNSNRKIA